MIVLLQSDWYLMKNAQNLDASNGILSVRGGIAVKTATGFFERLIGLLSYKELPCNSGLLIRKCSAVHTFGMRFTIDVLFLDSDDRVLKIVTLAPRKVHCLFSANSVLELSEGAADFHDIKAGDTLWKKEI